jgi:hypothetical protein
MGTPITIAAAVALLLGAVPSSISAARRPGLGRLLAERLMQKKAQPRPQTHATDFGTDAIGCVTLPRWELRRFGYPGHAFACEEGVHGEVLGAVLDRAGRTLCYIVGAYEGDGCYDIDICDQVETLCVE